MISHSARLTPSGESAARPIRALRTRSRRPRARWPRCKSSPWHPPWLRFAPCQCTRWRHARARSTAGFRI